MRAITYTINDDVKAVLNTINLILDYIMTNYYVDEDILFEIKVVLNELIVNALHHGNKCDRNKFAYVTFKLIANHLYLNVRDEGTGFNYKQETININPSLKNDLFCDHGRGLIIVQQLCKNVKFNKLGNKVSVIKNLYSD